MIPGYGDALSLIGDAKEYIEHPETATVGNVLGTVAVAAPWTPNVLGAARKVENAAGFSMLPNGDRVDRFGTTAF